MGLLTKGGGHVTSTAEETRAGRMNRRRGRKPRFSLWRRFVMLVGYAAILYALIRGAVYLLVLLENLK